MNSTKDHGKPPLALRGAYTPYIHGGNVTAKDVAPNTKRWRALPCYALFSCLKGSVCMDLRDHSVELDPGATLFIAPGARRRLAWARSAEIAWVNFDVLYQSERELRTPARFRDPPPDWPAGKPFVQPAPADVWGVTLKTGPYPGLAGRIAEVLNS